MLESLVAIPVKNKPGPKRLPDEERKAQTRARYARFRAKNLERRRAYEAEWSRNKRHRKAIEEGRVPGVIGHLSTMTREELISYISEWRGDEGKFILQIKSQNYRAQKLNIEGRITVKDVLAQLEIQKGCCAYCGNKFSVQVPEIDHWIPFKLGGLNIPTNIRLMHWKCNRTKGPKHPDELFSHLV